MYITEQRGKSRFMQLLKACFVIEAAKAANIETKNQEKERKNVMSLKHNKYFRRIAAALMAGTMMVSMFGMTAFAEDGDIGAGKGNNVLVKKTLEKGINVPTPDTSFTFTVTKGDKDAKGEKGISDAILNGGTVTIDFEPSTDEDILAKNKVVMTSNEGFSFNADKFDQAGIYHYIVAEASGTYDGMTYDGVSRDLYVYVENVMDEDGNPTGDLQIAGYEMWNGSAKSDGFTNKYITEGSEDGKESLRITKEVTGKMGDLNREFEFTIAVSDNDENATENYYMVVTNKKGGTHTTSYTLTDGISQGFVLADGDSAVVYGLSAEDTYTVTETTEDSNYTTTVNGEEKKKLEDAKASTVPVVNFINTNTNGVPETGIVMNIAPYILMVVLAGGLAFLFLRRRKNNF